MSRQAPNRYLTKSHFRLATGCPTKLFYTGKPNIYPDKNQTDEFLQALAEGGFQVGALAQLMHPEGIEIKGSQHDAVLAETRVYLRQEHVTLFEAGIAYGNLFARIDILRKQGDQIDLIEVKAKSFGSREGTSFRGARGGIQSDMLPYLQDIAFQAHIFRQTYPELTLRCYLMMPDKAKTCTVDGLNQKFKIRRENGRPVVSIEDGMDHASIGEPILTCVNVDEFVEEILKNPLSAPGVSNLFPNVVDLWSEYYCSDRKIPPTIGAQCAKCEFTSSPANIDKRNGLHECWQSVGWTPKQFSKGCVLDLWKFRDKQALIEQRKLKLKDITQDDIKYSEGKNGLTISQRQWMQITQRWPGEHQNFFLDSALMTKEMGQWQYPLHFIDFETARVAIPLFKGQRPYANISFQFSHHIVDTNGNLKHANQFLSARPGTNPNYYFVRALKAALGTEGSVFMWSPHENTTLNAILNELENDLNPPTDVRELIDFILTLTIQKSGTKTIHRGDRAMIDLCKLAERASFHPMTKGSCSIKKVLPAILASSDYLKSKYSNPIYGAEKGIPSLNFKEHVWWQESNGAVVDPYKLLPPVFSDLSLDIQDNLESDEYMEIAQGGAATMAYARLQFEDLPSVDRDNIEKALLRYCELDTLAMVMIYEAWKSWI